MRKSSRRYSILAVVALDAVLSAQAPPVPTVNHVLSILTLKPGIARDQIMKRLPDEVKATVRLYLDGKIEQWYSRADGKGVVFILNCKSADEAKALTDGLPFSKEGIAEFEYMPLGPLTPLRALLGDAPLAARPTP
jgi:hypothetical protein